MSREEELAAREKALEEREKNLERKERELGAFSAAGTFYLTVLDELYKKKL